jgi:hypothetical protein
LCCPRDPTARSAIDVERTAITAGLHPRPDMIVDAHRAQRLTDAAGGRRRRWGVAGITMALELEGSGIDTILLESGGRT